MGCDAFSTFLNHPEQLRYFGPPYLLLGMLVVMQNDVEVQSFLASRSEVNGSYDVEGKSDQATRPSRPSFNLKFDRYCWHLQTILIFREPLPLY